VLPEDSENDGGDESETSSTGNVRSRRVTRSTKTTKKKLKSSSKEKQSSKTEQIPRNPDLPFFHNRKKPPVKRNIDVMSDGEKDGEKKEKEEKTTISFKLPGADHKVAPATLNFTAPSNTVRH
jgi:hypothetical protein